MKPVSKIFILDFGSQYTQVIARRVREFNVYSEILRYDTPASVLASLRGQGIIISGGPSSVHAADARLPDPRIFEIGLPVLGICYGMQILGHMLGGKVARSDRREYGKGQLEVLTGSPLFEGLPPKLDVWNSHGDHVTELPEGFEAIGSTSNAPHAAIADSTRKLYGLQFHPEVAHTPRGKEILSNFIINICGARADWTMGQFVEIACDEIRRQVGSERVILGLSGGVDSSVAAALLHKAIGEQLQCIFVDNGLLRHNERKKVEDVFQEHLGLRLHVADAEERFLTKLEGVTDPETKRKIIGNEFIYVFEDATHRVGEAKYLAQGTLYPDVIESVSIDDNPAAVIKSHHNVGGLPEKMNFELVEPLRQLFKDEVRRLGEELGLPKEMVWRHPFPGPGLAVRCLGEITAEKLRILRDADRVVLEELKRSGVYYDVWQAFAVLLPVRSVGVMGDERTYDYTIAIRAVESQDAMTADWVKLDYELLGIMSTRIINEVDGVNRVVYDISSKPPATIEWE